MLGTLYRLSPYGNTYAYLALPLFGTLKTRGSESLGKLSKVI